MFFVLLTPCLAQDKVRAQLSVNSKDVSEKVLFPIEVSQKWRFINIEG